MFYTKHYSIALANVHTITPFLGYLWQTILNTGGAGLRTTRNAGELQEPKPEPKQPHFQEADLWIRL